MGQLRQLSEDNLILAELANLIFLLFDQSNNEHLPLLPNQNKS